MAVTQIQILQLYVATFNRAADKAGLDYWFNSGLAIEEIAQSFFDQSETQTLYPSANTDTDFINAIYNNIFGREADTDGLTYWLSELSANMTRSIMIEAMKNGAIGNDALLLTNKTAVAQAFVDAGLNNTTDAANVLNSVTANSNSVAIAKAFISTLEASSATAVTIIATASSLATGAVSGINNATTTDAATLAQLVAIDTSTTGTVTSVAVIDTEANLETLTTTNVSDYSILSVNVEDADIVSVAAGSLGLANVGTITLGEDSNDTAEVLGVTGSQNIITASTSDVVTVTVFGTYTGSLTGEATAVDIVKVDDTSNISGATIGAGFSTLAFDDATGSTTMNDAQIDAMTLITSSHNGSSGNTIILNDLMTSDMLDATLINTGLQITLKDIPSNTLTLTDATLDNTDTLIINATTLTATNALTYVGTGETTVGTKVIIKGGSAADNITGGASTDTIVFANTNGSDIITSFTNGIDKLDFSATSGKGTLAKVAITNGALDASFIVDGANTSIYVIDTDATDLGTTTDPNADGVGSINFSDITEVGAFLNEGVTTSNTIGEVHYFIINDGTSATKSYIYKFLDDGSDTVLDANGSELTLIGTLTTDATATTTTEILV